MIIPKIAGVVGAVVIVLIVAIALASTLLSADVTGSLATGSEKLTPDGSPAGKALVVYDPGLLGAPKNSATKIAEDLKSRGYEVELAGVNGINAVNISGYDVVIVGGPIYGGKVSSSIRSYLEAMNIPANRKIGAFAVGSLFKDYVTKPFPDAMPLKAVMLQFNGDDTDKKCADFIDRLLK